MSAISANVASLANPAHRLAALVFIDIVDSTALKSRYRYDYLPLLERHNELFETGIGEISGAEIIKHTGDGYFAAFPTASDAVHFALLFQARMKVEPWQPVKIEARLGIHIGEVVFVEMASRKDIVALCVDIAARLMDLAVGGQILLTETAFNDARQYVNRTPEILGKTPPLKWIAHGRYLFKGNDEPLEVFEVGIENSFPLRQPADSPKVKRVVPHDQEPTLGWRPAKSLEVPSRAGWKLLRKLGEGGFGEVWLGEHQKLKELRVFKFCFDVERLRSLKREYTLFRLLREALGSRTDIAALYEVKLDEPPFFLESEYTAGGNFLEWCEKKGGIKTLPLHARIELLAKVADALAAAHSVGVLHKDLKPTNILIHQTADGKIYPRLADFGIGALSDRSRLKAHNVTESSYTELSSVTASSNSFGTRMYAPPESMRDTAFTTRGDIYALGVMLYQMAIADLLRPLAAGWERDISDEIMRNDIAAIVEGDPERRVPTADAVADLLRSQDARRAALEKSRNDAAVHQRRQRTRRLAARAVAALVTILIICVAVSTWYTGKLDRERNRAVAVAQNLVGVIEDADPENSNHEPPTAKSLIQNLSRRLDDTLTDDSQFSADIHSSIADALRNFSDGLAPADYAEAARINRKLHGDLDRRTLRAEFGIGYAKLKLDRYEEAQSILKAVLDKQTTALGPQDDDTFRTSTLYAFTVSNISGPQKAETLYKSAIEFRPLDSGHNDRDTIQAISAYASVERDLGHLTKAERLSKQALEWRTKNLPPDHWDTLKSQTAYASLLVDLGHPAEAVRPLQNVRDRREHLLGPNNPDTLHAMVAYADALAAMQKYSDAEPLYEEVCIDLQVRDQQDGKPQKDTMSALDGYADLLTSTNRAAQAEPKARQAYEYFRDSPATGPRLICRAAFVYAKTLDRLAKPQAAELYKNAAMNAVEFFGPGNPFTKSYALAYSNYLSTHDAGAK